MGTATTLPLYGEIPDHRHGFVDYVGEGFLIGAACGPALYSVRALRGYAPLAAGFLAAYSALFYASERAVALARGRDDGDRWNDVVAGAVSMGLLRVPLGARAAAVSALFGAAVSVALDGGDWAANEWDSRRFASRRPPPTRTGPLAPAAIRAEPGGVMHWLTSSATASAACPSITGEKVTTGTLG